jgi:hypothetical protein
MATYPLTSKENSRRIRVAIRRVFLDIWDPIGINDSPYAQDEYDSYIGRAFELLWAQATDAELNEYLVGIVDGMSMDGSRSSHEDVIQALRPINLHEQAQSTGRA